MQVWYRFVCPFIKRVVMVAIISLLVILTLSLLITRIAAVALVHTGLSKESAVFQSRSAFTGVGFTTAEAESVVDHPVRRKIIYLLMFLGNVGIISVISSLILSFLSIEKLEITLKTGVLVGGVALLWFLAQSKWIDRKLSYIIDKALSRYTNLNIQDYYSLLHLSDNYRVSEIKVEGDDWLADKELSEMELRDEGVRVLGIQRKEGEYLGAPRGETKVYPEDTLILYGRASLLESLDERKEGLLGEQGHNDAVAEQQEILDEQEDRKEEREE